MHVATFTDGSDGLVVICSQCGRFASSNRRGELHKHDCPSKGDQSAFQSDGARAAYRRVCEGKHPAYKHGNAKVLDPCVPAVALLRLAAEPAEGQRTGDFPT